MAETPATATETPLTILAIEDDAGDAEILRRHLEQIPDFHFRYLHRTDSESGLAALSQQQVGVVLLDYRLGAETGLEALKSLRSAGYLGPVIIVTGKGDEYVSANLIRAGADDYVAKKDLAPDILQRAIHNALAQQSRRQVEAQNQRLLVELQTTRSALEEKNHRLAELYETAHQFVDNVSHEFRTPLTVIKEFTAIIRDGLAGEISDEQREYLEIVLTRVDDLSTMVDDMLDISKLEAGILGVCRRNCQVADIIKGVRTTLERKAVAGKVSLDINLADALPAVYCDPEKIGRVIINLTVNAVKFSNEGGHATVWARRDGDESQLVIGVTDDGPGIAHENLQAIFERFKQVDGNVRASTKGFGLGLNIAKELVHLNFGDITVASELGKGSTFSFTVPIADPANLLTRYFKRICPPAVSLLCATADPTVDPARLDDVEQFLQHQLRRNDLLFRAAPHKWLVVAATQEQELATMISRLEKAWVEANRNRPSQDLPAIALEARGTCRGLDQNAEFIRSFEVELRRSDRT